MSARHPGESVESPANWRGSTIWPWTLIVAEERIGFCGLGTMGAAMAANLVRAGFALTVWNRTPGRAGELLGAGATEAATPRAVAAASHITVICVSDTPDVEAVLLGPDGVAEGAAPGSLVIDCSTIDPAATRRFAARLAERGVAMVDAPVSGGSEGAQKGTLSIMVGGEAADVERARPVLAAMGKAVTHMGPIGSGQATKAVNQVILAGTYLGVAEGLVLAMKAGLDVHKVVEALSGGAAQSWVLANRSGRMIDNDYPLGFKIALHLKDLMIALDMARDTGAALPVTAMTSQIENGLVAQGHGEDDISAIARAIRAWSGLES
jgi:3-hydroxyisobutyrate dehydrogenase